MADETIWIAHAETLANQSSFTPAPGGSKELMAEFAGEAERCLAAYRSMRKGERLTADAVTTRLFWRTPGQTPFPGSVPPVIANGGIFLREDVVKVLREFDLDQAQLFPVEIFDTDRAGSTGVIVWWLNPVNNKPTVDPVRSELRQPRVGIKVLSYYLVPTWLRTGHRKIMTHHSALGGADIWIDPVLPEVLFMTDRLARRLVKDGWQKAFQLYPTTLMS